MELPTTPIGKQQIIDVKAGAILRNNRKKAQLFGCSSKVSVIVILFVKCALIITWLVREYETFPNGCEFLANGFDTEYEEEYEEYGEKYRRHVDMLDESFANEWKRRKRSTTVIEQLDPRARTGKYRKMTKEKLHSTVITMTNTQELLTSNDVKVKMKTIRSRLEPVNRGTDQVDAQDMDDDTLEINLKGVDAEDEDGPPRIYVSPIVNRRTNEVDPLPEKSNKLKGKKKGKGQKKNKGKVQSIGEEPVSPVILVAEEQTQMEPKKAPDEKKKDKKNRKGKGRKKDQRIEEPRPTTRLPHTEQTKSPRHLFSPPAAVQSTTADPHNTDFLHGVFDPNDPKFSNKGEIRIYPMHPANRKPKPSMKLSKETRMMWEMDETNFTTHMSPNVEDERKQEKSADDFLRSLAVFPLPKAETEAPPTTTTEATPMRDFYSTHKVVTWAKKEDRPQPRRMTTTTPMPEEEDDEEPTTTQQVAVYYETVKEPAPPKQKQKAATTLEQLEADMEPMELSTLRPRVVKHGFDRSQDDLIDAGEFNYPIERTTTEETVEKGGHRFQDQLTAFTASAVCFIRSMLDLWCILQVFSAVPYFIGVCFSRRYLYITHFALDVIFLVVGFVFSVTAIVFSIILFAIVDEMSKTTLFWWLLFAFGLDILLTIYLLSVYYSIKMCEKSVLEWRSLKTPPRSNSYHEEGGLL